MAELTDELAAAILSGDVGAILDSRLTWAPKNHRKNGVPSKIEGTARLGGHNLGHAFDIVMRLNPDKPWQHTCFVIHTTSRLHVKRLDLRGTHRDRDGGEEWVNQTHKHQWSAARGDKFVYTPDDIRHEPNVPLCTSMKDLDHEYRQVFEDFTIECKIPLGTGYSWIIPPYPETPNVLPISERYP